MQATRGAAVAATEPGSSAPRRTVLVLGTALAVLLADVVSKVAIVATMHEGETVRVLGRLLRIDYTRNAGAAFSIGTGATVLFTAVAVVVAVVIVRQARRLVSRSWGVTLGLLLGGALGNLVDRLLRSPGPLRGHVVDWIELPHWPVFNIADSAIVIGGCIAVLLAARGVPLDASAESDTSSKGDPA
ncbi:MAG TPA: signal peptidase II [Mycobacteriales bacterium]|jgi:signal peptidase II|nr:signal peptidase II [Mycobacteriales bacterium]